MTPEEKTDLYRTVDVDHLIKMRLAKLYVPGYCYDDLVQEGRMAAWAALDSYDVSKGKLGTYLTRVIRNAMITLLSTATAQKRRPPVPPDPEALARIPDRNPNAEEAALTHERLATIRRAVERAQKRLGESERRVMECYMSPPPELITTIRNLGRRRLSKYALAAYLGTTPDRLTTIIRRIRNEMRPVILDLR